MNSGFSDLVLADIIIPEIMSINNVSNNLVFILLFPLYEVLTESCNIEVLVL
jgi:hypothetical protein